MKKLSILYVGVMALLIVLMPMIIVKSCSVDYQTRNISNEKKPDPKPIASNGKKEVDPVPTIEVYMHTTKKYEKLKLEEYVKGVLAAEMPASFNPEALKAQAVAARTYSYARLMKVYGPRDEAHPKAPVCTDYRHCQAYISKSDVIKNAGIVNGIKKWRALEQAVKSTSGMMIYYKDKLANPLFHSSSGGATEDAHLVWGGKGEPYLTSVKSPGEEGTPGFITTIDISKEDFLNKLKALRPQTTLKPVSSTVSFANDIQVASRTSTNRVMEVKICNEIFKGTEVRTALALRSTIFYFADDGDKIKITTYGFGHGVGMSQYGANVMAKGGADYKEILLHYYKGVTIKQEY